MKGCNKNATAGLYVNSNIMFIVIEFSCLVLFATLAVRVTFNFVIFLNCEIRENNMCYGTLN